MNKNFTTLGYRPDFDTMTIILTKKFAKSASIVGSKDYKNLCRIRKDYPDYKVVVREIAKNEGKKNTHKNLTYPAMKAYIETTMGMTTHAKGSASLSYLKQQRNSWPSYFATPWVLIFRLMPMTLLVLSLPFPPLRVLMPCLG